MSCIVAREPVFKETDASCLLRVEVVAACLGPDAEGGVGVCPVPLRPKPPGGGLRAAGTAGRLLRPEAMSVGTLVKQASKGETMMFEKSH